MQRAVTDSVAFQRDLHVKEEDEAEQAIKAEGCEIVALDSRSTTPSRPPCGRSRPRPASFWVTSCSR